MKKQIAIFCVTYHSYDCLHAYLTSLGRAAEVMGGEGEVSVFVADNTTADFQTIDPARYPMAVSVYAWHENLGYMGAVQRMMRETDLSRFDYVWITNVDILLEEDALRTLCRYACRETTGWIAPCVFSCQEQRDRNPNILHRLTKRRFRLMGLMFRYPLLRMLYRSTLYHRRRATASTPAGTPIYAGHGSAMILTRQYFRRLGIPAFPLFLIGEEVYLAEMCRRAALDVRYEPAIRILDKEHVSTSRLPSALHNRCYREYYAYVMKTFY